MNHQRIRFSIALLAAAALLLGGAAWSRPAAGEEAMGEAVSSETCADCHTDQVASFRSNPHVVLEGEGWSAAGGACASCHSGAAQHAEEGGGMGNVFNFGDDALPPEKNASCQGCHGDSHPRWAASSHAQAGLSCTDCHGIHWEGPPPAALLIADVGAEAATTAALVPARSVSQSCASCHTDVFTQFQFNERHRLQEGILSCTSCHNPHEPSARARLGGFKQQACAECHARQSGPFVFEHGASRVEGCTACHSPHGSPNRHMLAFQNQAELCYSCHVAVPGFHARFTLESQCTNCHSSIHGSNFDPAFLK